MDFRRWETNAVGLQSNKAECAWSASHIYLALERIILGLPQSENNNFFSMLGKSLGILQSQGKVREFYYYDVLGINKKHIIQKKHSWRWSILTIEILWKNIPTSREDIKRPKMKALVAFWICWWKIWNVRKTGEFYFSFYKAWLTCRQWNHDFTDLGLTNNIPSPGNSKIFGKAARYDETSLQRTYLISPLALRYIKVPMYL